MNRSLAHLALTAALSMSAGVAFAQTSAPPTTTPPAAQEPRTTQPQTQEPMTTQSQATAATQVLEARFNAMDKNHDGFLSKDEVGKDRQLTQNFGVWDTNGDGKISRSEFDNHA